MDIIFPEVSRKDSSDAFQAMCEWLDRQVSKAVLGQTMTADDGSSHSQAKVHDGVRMDILRADAVSLGLTLNQQLVRPFVDLNWGPQKTYPRIQFNLPAIRDVASLSDALSKLVPLGLKVDQEVVRGILGLPDPAEGVDLLEAPKPPPAPVMVPQAPDPTPSLLGDSAQNRMIPEPLDALDRLAGAALDDWEPAMRPILNPLAQAALDAPSLEAFRSQLAGLLGQMDTSQLADLLSRTTFNARLAGDSGADTGIRASNIQQSSASRLHITVGEPKTPAVRIVPERDNEGRIISYTVHQEEQP
jgi:phage gp29-like protein